MIKYCRFLLLILLSASMLLAAGCGAKKKKTDFIYKITDGYAVVTGYSGLESEISIPKKLGGKTVKQIEENAFKGMAGLKKVKIPDTVEKIDYAFSECPDLTAVVLGSGIKTMNGAFKNCPKLANADGGENAVELSEAFMNCVSLTSGHIPQGAVACESAYRGCKALTEAIIDEGVTALPYTFEGCTSLTEVTLPLTVTEAQHTFENCSSLTSVTGCESLTVLENTFASCPSLTLVSLGENVKILKGAFLNCTALTSVTGLPSEVESYSPSFAGCVALTEMLIPKMAESEAASYDLASDVKGCAKLEKLTVNSTFFVAGEFCTTFAGCSSILEVNLLQESANALLRVDATYADRLFDGKRTDVSKALKNAKNASGVRVAPNFGIIGDTSYTHISGSDVEYFSYKDLAASQDISKFYSFNKSYYWCGYPKETNRRTTAVAIERCYTFYLRVTGINDGTLPSTVIVNGKECVIQDS